MNTASPTLADAEPAGAKVIRSISVILPAFNEQFNVRKTVETARRVLRPLAEKWEIIVVNDGSVDATRAICDVLARQFSDVRAIHHMENLGYGAALKSGISAARNELIFFTDTDGQFDFQELTQLLEWIDRYEIVIGYRGKRSDPFYRLVNAWGWNMLVRLLLGVRVRDIDCAFKIFRREVFQRVQIRSVGAMVNTEILAQALRIGMKIHEIPVTHHPRNHGAPTGAKLRVIAKAFRELCRLWSKLRRINEDQEGLLPRVSVELSQPAHH